MALLNAASLHIEKTVDKFIAYSGDILTYNIAITNTGSLDANNVVLSDTLPGGTSYIPASLIVSAPFTGGIPTAITLTNPILAGATVTMSFKATVAGLPTPNPLNNIATAAYTYTINPQFPNGVSATAQSNGAQTAVFKNNYSQQISSLIESVALEEAALAAILNAEGAKIQRFAAMPNVTPQMLICLNKSVSEMTDSVTILQGILRQKLGSVECQITGDCV